jgi:hypothetical protein
LIKKMADIKSIAEAYQSIYEEKVDLTEENIVEELLDESFDELVDELIEEGYSEEEAIEMVDEATDLYIDSVLCEVSDSYYDSAVRASKKAARGIDKAARQKRRAGQVRYAKRKAGEALSAVKSKAKGAVAGAQIAGSIAKDEARRAGRKAAHAVTSAPGKAKATVDRKKKETKRGIKGFIKRQAEKVVKRMSEGANGEQLVERPVVLLPGKHGYVATGPINKDDKKVSGLGPIGTYSAAKPASSGGKKTTATMSMQNNSNELEGEMVDEARRADKEGFEALKASGLFSEQEIAKIAEQMTTVTSVPPAGDSFRTGSNAAPKPPTLPPAPKTKKKPEPKLGHGTPGFQYGLGTGP